MTDLAWAAGLFDGEGNISICSNGPSGRGYVYLRISVSSTDYELIEPFRAHWGGCIVEQDRGGVRRVQYRWDQRNRHAETVLRDLLPYMRKRRNVAKAELALEFQAQRRSQRGATVDPTYRERQLSYHQQMKALTRRGR